MLRRLSGVLGLALLVAACGNGRVDPCKRALQRLVDDCNYTISNLDSVSTNCSGQSACVAGCLENSPCADIAANDGEFATCVNACSKIK
jgi:hypothetical protein